MSLTITTVIKKYQIALVPGNARRKFSCMKLCVEFESSILYGFIEFCCKIFSMKFLTSYFFSSLERNESKNEN
jgi:hypothetical protein